MLIPENEQQNLLDNFWTMLRECETTAENNNDVLLKHWVGQWYKQFSRITGKVYKPRWVEED